MLIPGKGGLRDTRRSRRRPSGGRGGDVLSVATYYSTEGCFRLCVAVRCRSVQSRAERAFEQAEAWRGIFNDTNWVRRALCIYSMKRRGARWA